MELDDEKGAEQDQRLQISLALQAAFLDYGKSADGFAFVNQLVVRKFGKDADKTEAAFKSLVSLVSSKYRQTLSLLCEDAKVPMVVFVKYQGEGKDVQAFFQPWIRVRTPEHGADPTLPDFYIKHPLRTAKGYEAAWRAADVSKQAASAGRPVKAISGTDDSSSVVAAQEIASPRFESAGRLVEATSKTGDLGSVALSEEIANPRPKNESEPRDAPAAHPVAGSAQTPYAKLQDFLVQEVIEERSATRRSRRMRSALFGMFGFFGCLVAIFHVAMILLESNGIIARSR
jgi:hypothetical protein